MPVRRSGGVVGGCLGALFAAVIALIVVASFIGALLGPDPEPTPSPWPSTTTSRPPQTPGPTPTRDSSPAPTPSPQPTPEPPQPPPNDPTVRQHPQGSYVNEGYSAPSGYIDGPAPSSTSEAVDWRVNNTIYPQPVPIPVRCELDVLDYDAATMDELKAHISYWNDCLMRVWGPAVEASGDVMRQPEIRYVSNTPFETRCGLVDGHVAGLYCGADNSITIVVDVHGTRYGNEARLVPYVEGTYAHEMGHFVQDRVGLLSASWWVEYYSESVDAKNAESRMLEWQAQCFGGIAFHALQQSLGFTDADMADLARNARRRGDAEHGTSEEQGAWWDLGTQATSIGQCNTFR